MKLTVDGQSFAVEPGPDGDLVLIDGTPFKIRREGNGNISTVLVDGKPYKVDLSLAAGMAIVDGVVYQVSLEGAARTGARGPAPKKAAKKPVALSMLCRARSVGSAQQATRYRRRRRASWKT